MHSPALYTFFSFFITYASCSNNAHVIVIGAGASGIAAATRLYQNGITNITILEAENRIGGRIYSTKFEESYIDLGAQWCHGEKGNVVYNLVKHLNILKDDEITPEIYHSKLKLIDKDVSLKLLNIFEATYMNADDQQQRSLGDVLIESYNLAIHETWEGEDDKISIAEDCLDLFHKWVISYEGAFSWFNISSDGHFEITEGNQQLSWDGLGYKTILEVLMQKFPESTNPIPIDDKILLNKEVIKIDWADTKVVVSCSDGNNYTGDHVISTVSLGVLKDRYNTLFQPQLPNEKITAIQTLGIDAVGKIFVHFPNKWWSDDFEGISFAWSKEDLKKTAEEFLDGPKQDEKSWIHAIGTILSVPKSPNLLAVWVSGEFVPEIENTSDEIIINGVMHLLNNFIGQDYTNLTRPDRIIRNNWYTNPHFRGTYSYETVLSQKLNASQEIILSEPLYSKHGKPSLLFAGEATHPIHYSTVHGAIETGFREADRLINFYK